MVTPFDIDSGTFLGILVGFREVNDMFHTDTSKLTVVQINRQPIDNGSILIGCFDSFHYFF